MQYVRSPTATVGYGMCLGMGGFLLCCGGEKARWEGRGGAAVVGEREPAEGAWWCWWEGGPAAQGACRGAQLRLAAHPCSLSPAVPHTLVGGLKPWPQTPLAPPYAPRNHPPGYRYAMPHSILMMHHPSGSSRGQASDMQIEARELVRMRDYLSLLVSDHTGQPYDRVSACLFVCVLGGGGCGAAVRPG
jgi:hypothetical protein